jgi:alpha-tubulin suppressor-like RCC1 family protein
MRAAQATLAVIVVAGGLFACNYVIGYDKLRKVNRPIALLPDGALVFIAATEVGLGARHTCATFEDGSLRCWGRNDFGQLGVGGTDNELVPRVVPDVGDVTSLSMGEHHTCVTRKSGETWCWGANQDGQLGIGAADDELHDRPVRSLAAPPKQEMATKAEHACELRDGAIYCTGRNDSGQLGLGDVVDRPTPTMITF